MNNGQTLIAGQGMRLVAPPEGFVAPTRVTAGPRLSQRHPRLYPAAVWANRVRRRISWLRSDAAWVTHRQERPLAHRVKLHSSLLLRELSEDEMHLQRNKVVNLRLAVRQVDTILIRPGETFSFNKVFARDEAFIKSGDDVFRRSEIWRTVIDRRTGRTLREELLKQNCALVKYHPLDVDVIDCSLPYAAPTTEAAAGAGVATVPS